VVVGSEGELVVVGNIHFKIDAGSLWEYLCVYLRCGELLLDYLYTAKNS
jgi:hypothetical protein